jgi:phage gp46-like protein
MTGWVDPLFMPEWDGAPLPIAATTGDVLLLWNNVDGLGDWSLAEGDIATGQDLETACLASLFTDALATPDFVPTDGTTNRRGWWATPYGGNQGSNLWQLDRATSTRATLGIARRFTLDGLSWLIDDGIAASIAVDTAFVGGGTSMIGIAVAITKPDGTMTRFTFGWAWSGLASLTSPVVVPPVPQRRIARAV